MYEIIPCRPAHLHAVESRPEMAFGVPPGWEESNPEAVHLLGLYARTFRDPATRKVLACVGVLPRWEGVGMAFTMLSVEILAQYAVPFTLRVDKLLSEAADRFKLYRVEAYTPVEFEAGRQWLEALQFIREDIDGMLQFGPGGSGVWALYARCS